MPALKDLKIHQDIKMDVFEYDDYRSVLRDYFQKCKAVNYRYSLRHFSKRLGVSHGYTQRLLNRGISMSDKILEVFVDIIGFGEEEYDYFELLVRMARTGEGSALYEKYQQRLRQIRQQRVSLCSVDEEQLRCLSSWLHLLILEMTHMEGASLNPLWFKKMLSPHFEVKTPDILRCLDDLMRAELLKETDYQLERSEPMITFNDRRFTRLLKKFHGEALQYSQQGLASSGKLREYQSLIVATTPEKFQLLKQRLKQEGVRILKELHTEPGEASMVVSLGFQLFPLTQMELP